MRNEKWEMINSTLQMITAHSTPNIALIKYWGSRHVPLRLPYNDSLSMTLDSPGIEMTVDHADELSVISFTMGKPMELGEKELLRFSKPLELAKEYLAKLGAPEALPGSLSINITSHIPPAIGIASSAAVFSCLATAIRGLVKEDIELTDKQTSVIARFGAGSASRSIFGGYSAFRAGEGEEIDTAYGEQIADENHWLLHNIIIVPSQEMKKVGSSEGHAFAHTSPHYAARVEAIQPHRQQDCIDAVLAKDFEKLQVVTEEDCMDMHENVMQQQEPPLHYLSAETYRIIREVTDLREREHLPVLYTMDAGPTVHLFCPDEAREQVLEYAKSQAGCEVFETRVGKGATTQ